MCVCVCDDDDDDDDDSNHALTSFAAGLIGQPNAGKSTILNSIVGRKVVSVSRTPGHTKHFQVG